MTKSPEKKVNSNSNKNYYEKDYDKSYDKGYEKSYDRSYSNKQQSYSKSPEKHLPALRNNKAKYGINSSLSNRFNSSVLNTLNIHWHKLPSW